MPDELDSILGGTLRKKPPVVAPADKKLLDDTLMPPAPPTIAPPPVTHRAFGDATAMRTNIFGNVLGALQKKYPMENTRYRLELQGLRYADQNPFSLEDQKKAIIGGHTLDKQIHGDWVLTDKASGKEVDRKGGVVAHVPYATDRGTFIYQGSEWTVGNQARLKPGVYSRVKENGEIEAHINTKPGTGPSFKLYMEPDTGVFRLGVGQSTLKLYPILRAMGVPDKEIEKHWGHDLLAKNIEAEDARAVGRAFAKLVATRSDVEHSEANLPAPAIPQTDLWKEAEMLDQLANS